MKYIVCVLIFLVFNYASSEVVIQVHSQVLVNGDASELNLGQIGKMNGSDEDVLKYKNMLIDSSPEIGERRLYSLQQLSSLFRKIKQDHKIKFILPKEMVVENVGYVFSSDAVAQSLMKIWGDRCTDCEFTITQIKLPQIPKAVSGLRWSFHRATEIPKGSFSALVKFGEGFSSKNYWVTGAVEVFRRVPVLNVSLGANQKIEPSNIKFELRNVTFNHDSPLKSGEIENQRIRRAMREGEILWRNDIIREKFVVRGETVKVVYGGDNWSVSSNAIAEQDGYQGDRVQIKNIRSKKTMTAQVVARGEVLVQ